MEDEQAPGRARIDAAVSVRRLVHSLVGHDGSEAELAELARVAGELADRMEAGARRVRPPGQMLRYEAPVPDGSELTCWPDCMVAGVAHPNGTGLQSRRVGNEAVASVVLGPAHEGPPGRAHGGMVASLFDEVMGFALWMEAVPAYTARLQVDYRSPVPLEEPIELRAEITGRERRKVFVSARASCRGEVVAEAEGLFVVPREWAER